MSVDASFRKKSYFSPGSEKNLKITTLEDLEIFKALLNSTMMTGSSKEGKKMNLLENETYLSNLKMCVQKLLIYFKNSKINLS
ncbi:hypothetical protein SNF32_06640 [Enterococcus mundtii]|nr:hypothetical protein [Enterococcus mundtii]